MGQIPPERELIGCVAIVLKASQGFDILPHFDYILQKSPVFLLLTVSQLPGVPEILRERRNHTIHFVVRSLRGEIIWGTDLISKL